MAAVVETVNTYPDLMVKLGLATPLSRAFLAGTIAAGLAYIGRYPSSAFGTNGALKPIGLFSREPGAGNAEFLYVPVGVTFAAYLLT